MASQFPVPKLFSTVRARIFFWYVGLLGVFLLLGVPLLVRTLYNQVDERVREDFAEEVELFEALKTKDSAVLREFEILPEKVPNIQEPEDLITLFNLYFGSHLPEDDTFLIGIIGSEFYRASPEVLPPELEPGSPLMQTLKQENSALQGFLENPGSPRGDILYQIKLIRSEEQQVLGRLFVVHLVAGERAEVLEAVRGAGGVLLIIVFLAVGATAFVAGRVLSPLKDILTAAHSINESNLSERIPVKSRGELGDLALAINDMMDRLEKSFRLQRRFINDAGHELRTPITIMLGHLELMDTTALPESEQEVIPIVFSELERMERLVGDLILLAKAEQPDFLQRETFELEPFLKEVFLKVQGLTSEARQWEFQLNTTGAIFADRQRLTQVLMNLAQNAVQHTQKGDRIQLGAKITTTDYEIWLEDSGEGIEEQHHTQIFERFSRVQYRQRKSDGSGLGLAIAKQIVEAHQGHMNLSSTPNQGSKFSVLLPRLSSISG